MGRFIRQMIRDLEREELKRHAGKDLMTCSHCLGLFDHKDLVLDPDFYAKGQHAWACPECYGETTHVQR